MQHQPGQDKVAQQRREDQPQQHQQVAPVGQAVVAGEVDLGGLGDFEQPDGATCGVADRGRGGDPVTVVVVVELGRGDLAGEQRGRWCSLMG